MCVYMCMWVYMRENVNLFVYPLVHVGVCASACDVYVSPNVSAHMHGYELVLAWTIVKLYANLYACVCVRMSVYVCI